MRYKHKHLCIYSFFFHLYIKDHNPSNKSLLFFITNFHVLYCLEFLLFVLLRFLFFNSHYHLVSFFFDDHIYISSFPLMTSVFCPCSSMSCVFRKCFCDSKSSPIWMPKKKSNGHVVYKHRSR